MSVYVLRLISIPLVTAVAVGVAVMTKNLLWSHVTFGVLFFLAMSVEVFYLGYGSRHRVRGLFKSALVSTAITTAIGTLFTILYVLYQPDVSSFTPLISGLIALINVGFYTSVIVLGTGTALLLVAEVFFPSKKTEFNEETPIKAKKKNGRERGQASL